MAVETPCQTSGAVFHTNISRRQVTVAVDLPFDLDLDEMCAMVLDATLHNAVEMVLAPYWARRP